MKTVEASTARKNKILHFESIMTRDKHFVGFHVPNVIIQQIWPKEAEYARISYDIERDCLIIVPWE